MPFETLRRNLEDFGRECANVQFNAPDPFSKDKFFAETNAFGISLIQNRKFNEAAHFYRECITRIEQWEAINQIKLPIGMQTGNLAICLLAIEHLDHGIALLIQAFEDDKKYRNPTPLGKQPMYTQFEEIHFGTLFGVISNSWATERQNILAFLDKAEKMNIEYRLSYFHLATMVGINLLMLLKNPGCIFSKIRLFVLLRDLCVLYEEIMKETSGRQEMMGSLLQGLGKISKANVKFGSSKSEAEFEKNISDILNGTYSNPVEISYLLTYCIRNFTSHNFKIQCPNFFAKSIIIIEHLFSRVPQNLCGDMQ